MAARGREEVLTTLRTMEEHGILDKNANGEYIFH
jgi:hypothetical protein